ncbi:MAG: cation transporter [Bdellovibrionales bacterium]|nr:cation transporter [Bdellovibrionales bacterium]
MSEPRRIRLFAMILSLGAGVAILALKLYAARVADSSALRSDALEGMVNILAAAFGLGSIIFAEKPADRDHPYGHGKIEYFAQAFEGGLIALAGFLIILDTVERIYNPHEILNLGLGLKLNIVAGLGNGVLGFFLVSIGRKYQSTTIRADGIHLLTDLITTAGMALGLGLMMWTGWHWIDPVLAIMVAVFLFRTGFQLVRHSSQALLDAENPELIKKIVEHLNVLQKDPIFHQILAVHGLKAQEFGRDKHVDIHVVVPEFLSIKDAHDLADRYAYSLHLMLGNDSEVHTHVDPCEQALCKTCPIQFCDIRAADFQSRPAITMESATEPGEH